MSLIYNLFIILYWLAARCLSIKNKKAKQWIEGRKEIFKQLSSQISHNSDIIWFHCASLGEFEQARPLIEYVKQQQPAYKILLTFFSPSGYEIQKNYKNADYIFYLPHDTVSNAKKFLRIVQPKYIFFIKYEFWYNYVYQAYKQNIPFYSVSCIFSKEQFYFKWYGRWFRKQLLYITHFFVQDEHSKNLLNQYGIFQANVCGDTRFDRVYKIVNQAKQIEFFDDLGTKNNIIVAGSTWNEDEKLLVQLLNNYNFTLIIAPHEIHEEHIKEIEKRFSNYLPIRYTQLSSEINIKQKQVIIIDLIGILNFLYKYASIAYIGGGFGKGIHNVLEAAAYEKPVIFGPNYKKFKEANDLIRLSAAFSVSNYEDLNTIVGKLCANLQTMKSAGNKAKQYVLDNIGTCKKIYETIFLNKILNTNMKYLIVGLGNMGREYDGTRHNIGFEAIDYIAHLNNLCFASDRYAYICEFRFKGKTIVLVKPTTYMNLSGKAVRYHLQKLNISIENLLVIADDKDLPIGKIKLKPKGTGGTHNGMNNIVTILNTLDFARLRIGIGNDYAKGFQAEYVLSKFTEEEKKQLRPNIELSVEIVKNFVTQGLDKTMNLYN